MRKKSVALASYLVAPPRRRSVEDDLRNRVGIMDMLKIYYRADEEEDVRLVSDKALFQRESLRFNKKIRDLLDHIWDWTDVDNSGDIDEEEYCTMFHVLWKVVWSDLPDAEAHSRPREEVEEIAKVEFKRDLMGAELMDKMHFNQSFFQMADTWSDDISETGAY